MKHNYVTDIEKAELLKLDYETITNIEIARLFGTTIDQDTKKPIPPKFNTRSGMKLKAGEYINTTDVDTSVGIFLMNKLFIEGCVDHTIPNRYFNEVMDGGKVKKLFNLIATALRNGDIDVPTQLYDFYRRYEFWSLNLVTIFSPSYSASLIKPSKALDEYRDDLMKKNPNPNIQEMVKMEDQLVKKAAELTEGDPGRALFDSGARGSFDNDFKNMFISIGPVKNPITNEFDFMESNYITGLEKKDLVAAGNLVVNAEFPKAIGTAVNGYQTKQFNSILQNVGINKELKDCGTTNGLQVVLDKNTLSAYYYQYIMGKNNKLLMIDENLPDDYLGIPLKIRSPMYCVSPDGFCKTCAGDRFERIDIENIGLLLMNMSSSMLNANLKQRHSMKVNVNKVNINKLLL